MGVNLNYSELEEYQRTMIQIATERYPTESMRFMQKAGNKLKSKIKDKIKATTKKKTGNLLRGYTRGRATKKGDSYQVRVYAHAPAYHAWLIEHGHALWIHHSQFSRGKYSGKRVEGTHAVSMVASEFKSTFGHMAVDFANSIVNTFGG